MRREVGLVEEVKWWCDYRAIACAMAEPGRIRGAPGAAPGRSEIVQKCAREWLNVLHEIIFGGQLQLPGRGVLGMEEGQVPPEIHPVIQSENAATREYTVGLVDGHPPGGYVQLITPSR